MNPESCEINDLLECHSHEGIGRRGQIYEWV